MKKILSIIVCLFLLTGCSSNLMEQTQILSDNILNIIYIENYDFSKLNKTNQELLNKLISKEKFENKVINITELDKFSDEGYDKTKENSYGIYKENDNYLIKYSDLNFEKNEFSSDFIAHLYVEGYPITIDKSLFPLLCTDTCGNINYKYRYMRREKTSDEINYYYRSFGNGSMLTIKYILEKNKITDIKLIYDKYYVEKTAD